jgi:hypothetical protein
MTVTTVHRPFTVYFDTNFYVWLANSSTGLAVVERLNSLGVRHVLCNIVLLELLADGSRPDAQQHLHAMLSRLQEPPLLLVPWASWDLLLASGSLRHHLARTLKWFNDGWSKATALSSVARGMGKRALADRRRSRPPMPEPLRSLLQALSRRLMSLSDAIRGTLPVDVVASIEGQNKTYDAATHGHGVVAEVTKGTASEQAVRRLANTERDSRRMAHFVRWQGDIDLFQMDRPQFNKLRAAKPGNHPLKEAGLTARCFSAEGEQGLERILEKLTTWRHESYSPQETK